MSELTRRPVTQDVFAKTAEVEKKTVEEKKPKVWTSLKVSKETRAQINALRDLKDMTNVEDLIVMMLEKELAALDDASRKAIEIISKTKM